MPHNAPTSQGLQLSSTHIPKNGSRSNHEAKSLISRVTLHSSSPVTVHVPFVERTTILKVVVVASHPPFYHRCFFHAVHIPISRFFQVLEARNSQYFEAKLLTHPNGALTEVLSYESMLLYKSVYLRINFR